MLWVHHFAVLRWHTVTMYSDDDSVAYSDVEGAEDAAAAIRERRIQPSRHVARPASSSSSQRQQKQRERERASRRRQEADDRARQRAQREAAARPRGGAGASRLVAQGGEDDDTVSEYSANSAEGQYRQREAVREEYVDDASVGGYTEDPAQSVGGSGTVYSRGSGPAPRGRGPARRRMPASPAVSVVSSVNFTFQRLDDVLEVARAAMGSTFPKRDIAEAVWHAVGKYVYDNLLKHKVRNPAQPAPWRGLLALSSPVACAASAGDQNPEARHVHV